MIDKEEINQAVIKGSIKRPKIIQQLWDKPYGGQEIVEVVNTKKQQLASVKLFASELGYFQTSDITGDSYLSLAFHNTKMNRVSFNTMIQWHNKGFMSYCRYHHGLEKELPVQAERLGFEVADMIRAINARLYQQVFLHGRKDKTVNCYKHVLRFA